MKHGKACKKGEKPQKGKEDTKRKNKREGCTRQRHKRPNMYKKAREKQSTLK